MAQIVEIPNVGNVEFPDGMSPSDITLAIKKMTMPVQQAQPATTQPQFASNAGGAAFGRPTRNIAQVQAEPRPLESAIMGATKSAVIDPILGASRLLTGGKVGAEAAKSYAEQAKPYQEANPGSYLTGQIGGSLVPATGVLKGAQISSLLTNPLAQNVATGAVLGALNPEETGKTGSNFYKEQLKHSALGGATGVIPTALEKGTSLLGSLLRKGVGISTGAGEEAINQAYQAGKTGNQAFIQNMNKEAPMEDVLASAKGALSNMRKDLSQKYQSGMLDVSKDKSVLDFKGIEDAVKSAKELGSFKGEIKNEDAMKAVQKAQEEISKWKNLDPAEYHTPEGFDALKQKIGGILESIPFEQKTARRAVGDIYGSIKNEIQNQAPVYADVMKDYSKGTALIDEITKSLSLGNKSTASAGLNKLQSLMRNNVNTNYGYRQELANKLIEKGAGEDLMPALAGQALSSWTPRGLVGQGIDAGVLMSLKTNPSSLLAVPVTSPRLMGNVAYGAGKLSNAGLSDKNKELAKLLMMESIQQGAK